MKNLLTFILLTLSVSTLGQTTIDFYSQLKSYDLSNVLNADSIQDDANTKFKRADPLGFIDTNYQRFQIHFTTFVKDKTNPYQYNVAGKTKVKDNICNFIGTITVVTANYDTSGFMKDIGFPTYKGGYITTQVLINEGKNQQGSGIIKGELTTDIYFDDKRKINYSALDLVADGFSNNQFVGTWTSYKTSKPKKCNWGDYRIPDCGNLDFGTGDFYPNEKYLNNGWENYYIANNNWNGDLEKRKKAIQAELNWWK